MSIRLTPCIQPVSSAAAATESAQKLEDELSAHKAQIMERLSRMQNVRTSQARQSAMQQQMNTRRAEITAQEVYDAILEADRIGRDYLAR